MAKRDFSAWTKEELVEEIKSLNRRKKFGLVWEDRPENTAQELLDFIPLVAEDQTKQLGTPDSDQTNLIIEGDNLHSLSLLNFTHKGAIDVIYIDPPYNRGGDFRYNDDYVDKEDSYRHSKWLSFMSKRLQLAKSLLAEHGVMFLSIDDVEHAKLRLLCEEIFGEKNIIADIAVVNNLKGRSDDAHFATAHEFLIVCARDSSQVQIGGFALDEKQIAEYKFSDEHGSYKPVGLQKTGKSSGREDRPNLYYPIYWNEKSDSVSLERVTNEDFEIFPLFADGREGNWRWGKETFAAKAKTEILVKKQARGPVVYVKMRLNSDGFDVRTTAPKSIWLDPKYDSGSGTKMLDKMFGSKVFPNPKPVPFLEDVLRISTKKDSLVLDFFAGSGSTGHSVLSLNKKDGGQRKFILCTNNEENIAEEVCYPRMKKVIFGYTTTDGIEVEGLGGDLRYFRIDGFPSEITDSTKRQISKLVSPLLSIKEHCFNRLSEANKFDVFGSHRHRLIVLFDDEQILDAAAYVDEHKECKFVIYVYSLGNDDFSDEFTKFGKRVQVHPIPESIINSYTQVKRQLVRK